MSQKRYKVTLTRAAAMVTPHGTFKTGRKYTVLETEVAKLNYLRRRSADFSIKEDNGVVAPRPLGVRGRAKRRAKRVREVAKPDVAPTVVEAAEANLEPPEDVADVEEPSAEALTEAKLRKLRRSELLEMAEEGFGLDIKSNANKASIISAILEKAKEKAEAEDAEE